MIEPFFQMNNSLDSYMWSMTRHGSMFHASWFMRTMQTNWNGDRIPLLTRTVEDLQEDMLFIEYKLNEKYFNQTPIILKNELIYADSINHAVSVMSLTDQNISFAIFFELLDEMQNEDTLDMLNSKIVKTCKGYEENAGQKIVPFVNIDQELLVTICKKYYRKMNDKTYNKIFANLTPENQEKLKYRRVISKFAL